MTCRIYLYDGCKYSASSKKIGTMLVHNVTDFTVVTDRKDAENIEEITDCLNDFYNEYLILKHNGIVSIFENNNVDLLVLENGRD